VTVLAVVAVLLGAALLAALACALHLARRLRVEAPATPTSANAERSATAAAEWTSQLSTEADEVADQLLLLGRFRYAIDHLQRAVVLWDADGQEIYRNRAADAMFEARDGQVLVAAAIEELMTEALSGREARRQVDLFGPPAASFVVTAEPFRAGEPVGEAGPAGGEVVPGSVTGAIALVEDRSQERRIEVVRRDFIANISHELKTPIGAIGLLAETLRDEPDLTVVARLSDRLVAESERLGRTVDDLLELSGIELGDETEFDDLDVRSLVGEAESRLGAAAEQAGVKVRMEVPRDTVLNGDRRQLVSALYNLLDNAVKYSPEDSEIVVSCTVDADDGSMRIAVSDNGIGVPRRDLDRIFERFYRVDRARSRRTGGTGLGLAIVRHVAVNHGGDILVESTEGVGSTFILSLPSGRGPSGRGPSGRGPSGASAVRPRGAEHDEHDERRLP